jgi:hypothetical protein
MLLYDVLLGDDNISWEIINIVYKDTETLVHASMAVGLQINAEEIKCILMSRFQNVEKVITKIELTYR